MNKCGDSGYQLNSVVFLLGLILTKKSTVVDLFQSYATFYALGV